MQRGRRQEATDGDAAVGGIDVQLVALPGLLEALRIALGAHITVLRQSGDHLLHILLVQLLFQALGLPWPLLTLAWAAPLAPGLHLPVLPLRLLPGLDRRRIPGHMSNDLSFEGGCHQKCVQAFGNTVFGKFGNVENVASLGSRRIISQPHRRRSTGSQ